MNQKTSPEKQHPLLGNKFAAKDESEKLSESRTFRFRLKEMQAYDAAAAKQKISLRQWVRAQLNIAANLSAARKSPNPMHSVVAGRVEIRRMAA